jgi:hypothetical protein
MSKKIFVALVRGSSVVLLLVSFTCAQSSSQIQSLGDVAREQKEQKKNRKAAKTLTNDDLTLGSLTTPDVATGAPAESAEAQNPEPQEIKVTAPRSQPFVSSNLDRPKDSSPDVVVVPAGTELKVDLDDHKVVVPVRVGFATPIPALSHVAVKVTRSYVAFPYAGVQSYGGIANVGYAEYATVTAVTVGAKTYQVETSSVPLFISGANSEVTFTLSGPVEISR